MAEESRSSRIGTIPMPALSEAPMMASKNMEGWTRAAQANAEAFGKAMQASMSYALAWQQEIMQFGVKQMQKNMELWQELAGMRDPEQIMTKLSEANRAALEDHVRLIKDLADKSLEMLPEHVFSPIAERGKEAMQGTEQSRAKSAA